MGVAEENDERGIDILHGAGDGIGDAVFERLVVFRDGPFEVDQFGEDQVGLRGQRVDFAKADVVLQEEDDGRIQEDITLRGIELFEFRKGVLASEESLLFERTEPLLLAAGFEDEGCREVVEEFGGEENALFALRGFQFGDVAVIGEMADGGEHFGIGEIPGGIGGEQAGAEFSGS